MGIFDKFLKPEVNSQQIQTSLPQNQRKILIVEADPNLRNAYIQRFQSEGYIVSFAMDGAAGLNSLLTFEPELVVVDLELPVMNGKTMLHSMRALPAFKFTPVIAISERTDVDTVRQVKTYDNANALLLKTEASPDQVVGIIKTLI